jgi:uncharacterized peroxidase-related enzyme
MAYIPTDENMFGLRALFAFRPAVAEPLSRLKELLLHSAGTLSFSDRELIACFVASKEDCGYCRSAHGATAAYLTGGNDELVKQVLNDFESAPISSKLKALLAVAARLQQGSRNVHQEDIDRARRCGATDLEIHDTVLIASCVCLFSRYIDGLGVEGSSNPEAYRIAAPQIARFGYASVLREMELTRTAI